MSGDAEHLKEWQFQKGAPSANPKGRQEGTRTRFAKKFLEDLLKEWQEHGAAVLRIARIERPLEFARLAASCLPREVGVDVTEDVRLAIKGIAWLEDTAAEPVPIENYP